MNLSLITEEQFGAIKSLLEQKQVLQNQISEIDSTLLAFSASFSVYGKPVKAGKPAKAAKKTKGVKSVKAAAVVKAPKAVKATMKAVKKGGRKRRGDLKSGIVSLLKSAGSSGMHVKAVAKKLGTKTNNVYSWFYTTGKKLNLTKALGGGKFALK